MIFEHSDYRSFLKAELGDRVARNTRYSLSAFAKQLGMAKSMLSEVLKGKKSLSVEAAGRVASSLRLPARESEYFCLLVQKSGSRDPRIQEMTLSRMQALNTRREVRDLSLDAFKVISDWYHIPLIELFETEGFSYSPKTAAKALGISPFEAEAAVERLARLEILEPDPVNGYRRAHELGRFQSPAPNQALRDFHRQMLEKAIQSLTEQTNEVKFTGSETFAFDPDDLPKLRELAEEFFSRAIALAAKGPRKRQVYHCGVQFFRLTQDFGEIQKAKTKEKTL